MMVIRRLRLRLSHLPRDRDSFDHVSCDRDAFDRVSCNRDAFYHVSCNRDSFDCISSNRDAFDHVSCNRDAFDRISCDRVRTRSPFFLPPLPTWSIPLPRDGDLAFASAFTPSPPPSPLAVSTMQQSMLLATTPH
jgi:hypothetical protein